MVVVKVIDSDGVEHTLEVTDPSKSILDLAEDQWIELPYSCRSGACYACVAKVKKWAECLEQNKTGEKLVDTEEDEFLTCIGWVKKECVDKDEEVVLEMLV